MILSLIPTLTGKERTLKLAEQLSQHTHVIIVDNGMLFDREPPFAEVHSEGHNIGVPAAWNLGLRRMRAEEAQGLFVANDDIELSATALEVYLEAAAQPYTSLVISDPHPYAFFYITPRCLEQIGFFDETFWPGYAEDVDYNYRVDIYEKRQGFSIRARVPKLFEHRDSTTSRDLFGGDWRRRRDWWICENHQRYAHKWGGYPGREQQQDPEDPVFWQNTLGAFASRRPAYAVARERQCIIDRLSRVKKVPG